MDLVLAGVMLPGVENHSLTLLERAVKDAGFSCAIVPFLGWADLDRVIAEISRLRPRVVGLSVQTNQMALASLSLARILKQRGIVESILCGGHFATLNAEDILRSPAGVDAVVRFAGEAALVGWLRGEDRASLPGLLFRDRDEVRFGKPAQIVSPSVAVDRRLPEHLGFPSADVIFSRGCEAHCSYCCVAGATDLARREAKRAGVDDQGYRRQSLNAIAEELAQLWKRGARVFNFMDDNVLPVDPAEAESWTSALREALAQRGVGRFAFSMQLRADAATPAVLDGLIELGLTRAYVGIDGVSTGQLRTLGRHAASDAGPTALDRLAERGVFAVCNALILGPTFRFETVLAEIAALGRIRHAPVHLLPVDVRTGTTYLARAEEKGLVEGNFLWRRYRFADPRTALIAKVIGAMPTRLAERSVPIGLYDLGYNLGIARRLRPDLDVDTASETYARVANEWNRDQLRLLMAAAEPASRLDELAIARLIAREQPRVRAHDEALLAECDAAIVAVERAMSLSMQRAVRRHTRGRLLSGLAVSMTLAACDRDVLWRTPEDLAGKQPQDLAYQDLAYQQQQSADLSNPNGDGCLVANYLDPCQLFYCGSTVTVDISFDQNGVVSSVQGSNGATVPQMVIDCYQSLLEKYCYPSFANTTQAVHPACWIA
jgi:hypothetical protein